jgi:hypothetical protein
MKLLILMGPPLLTIKCELGILVIIVHHLMGCMMKYYLLAYINFEFCEGK